MERITLAQFKSAQLCSRNSLKGAIRDDFKGVISHEDKLEYYYQVDTDEYEYVYRHIPSTGNIYYTGSK